MFDILFSLFAVDIGNAIDAIVAGVAASAPLSIEEILEILEVDADDA
jgi:hypothetical protein